MYMIATFVKNETLKGNPETNKNCYFKRWGGGTRY